MAKTLEDTFWASVIISKDGCWIWQGQTERDGYGKINRAGNKVILAHRLSYEMHCGPIPGGCVVDHLCHTRRCVNPKHLQAVPQSVNAQYHTDGIENKRNTMSGTGQYAEEPITSVFMLLSRRIKELLAFAEKKGYL